MSDSLIEQVRKAANRMPIIKTVEPLPVSTRQEGPYFPRKQDYDELDLRLVLAHMQAQQAVVDAARELQKRNGVLAEAEDVINLCALGISREKKRAKLEAEFAVSSAKAMLRAALLALDTALENLRSDNDGK